MPKGEKRVVSTTSGLHDIYNLTGGRPIIPLSIYSSSIMKSFFIYYSEANY